MQRERNIGVVPFFREISDLKQRRVRVAGGPVDVPGKVPPRHQERETGVVELPRVVHAGLFAVAQDGHAPGDLHHLVEPVTDEEDREVAALQIADDRKERVDLRTRQGRGRLVHDDETGVLGDRAADRDQLAVRDRQIEDGPVGVERHADPAHRVVGGLPEPPPVHETAPLLHILPDADILGDGEVREERKILIDHLDARRDRRRRRQARARLSVDADLPRVRRVDAGHDLDERALSGAVLPDQAVHLARGDRKIDPLQRMNAAEGLSYSRKFDDEGHIPILQTEKGAAPTAGAAPFAATFPSNAARTSRECRSGFPRR